ncbi:MAG: M48 family metalloprotease [Cyanothece sp. SIO2G6]|nr:M48 family metalloprotease [Cyanothece sp. SIO2G6]
MKQIQRFFLVSLTALLLTVFTGTWPTIFKAVARSSNPVYVAQSLNDLAPILQQLPTSVRDRLTTFISGDELYRQGDAEGAAAFYRQVKPDFEVSDTQILEPIYEAEALSPESLADWQQAQLALDDDDEAGAIEALQSLVDREPAFIPAPVQLAELLMEEDEEDEAIAVLEEAATLHPYSTEIIMAQVETLADEKEYLEASIAAREFALLNLDHPQAPEFQALADEYFEKFSKRRRRRSIFGAIGNLAAGILTGDRVPWESWNSAVETAELVELMLASESEFGASLAAEYREQLPLVEDPDVVDYVTQLGLEVAQLMGRDFDYEFYVVQDSVMNAFALPGGKIFVNSGLILGANSQAELAGVLAHEAAHSVLSHGIQSFFRDDMLSQFADEVPLGEFATGLLSLQYSRNQERQADILGTRVLATAGYAADGLRNFMATLVAMTESAPPEYLSSHPNSESRVAYLEEMIQRNGYNRYALEGVDKHLAIQAKLS